MGWTTPKTWVLNEVFTSSDWNTYARDNAGFIQGDTSWVNATLISPWTNVGGSTPPASYRRRGQQVFVRGQVQGGTAGSNILQLPTGYRPAYYVLFWQAGAGGAGAYVWIDSTGIVSWRANGATPINLNGIVFLTTP